MHTSPLASGSRRIPTHHDAAYVEPRNSTAPVPKSDNSAPQIEVMPVIIDLLWR
jgi:hypothetical protein